jgi:hypothetical protein
MFDYIHKLSGGFGRDGATAIPPPTGTPSR